MAVRPIDITGGESVYCINQSQLAEAVRLSTAEDATGRKIRQGIQEIEEHYSRNERAALCFMVIERLLKGEEE